MASIIPEALRPLFVPGRARRGARILLVSVVLCGVGCSSTTFLYNRLDFLLPWYLGRYVDLDREQADWFDGRIERFLSWHRCTELPRYAAFLKRLEADLDAPLTPDLLEARVDDLETAWYRLRDPALDELLALGARLEAAQIDDFLAALRKRQGKYEDKYLERSEETFREDARENLEELLEDYLGRLTGAQRQRVARTAAELTRSDAIWLDERRTWIDRLESHLQREPGWQERIRTMIITWEAQLDDRALAVYDRNTALVQDAIVDIVNARSEGQDRRLRRRLRDLREDAQGLSADAPAGACAQVR